METERRAYCLQELRADVEPGQAPMIRGYAAVFDQLSEELGGFREKIQRGAFAANLAGADVRALFNHDPNLVLGRTKSGTLRLQEDIHGLRIEIDPPDTQAARDLMTSMQRGDIDQMSFGFQVIRDHWETDPEGKVTRTLLDVRLFDVSPVTYPAYPQTQVGVRSALASAAQAAGIDADALMDAIPRAQADPDARARIEGALRALNGESQAEPVQVDDTAAEAGNQAGLGLLRLRVDIAKRR